MIGWWWWFNVNFYYLSYIIGWKEGERMESSTLSWYWRIVSSSWSFIPPFTFGSCSYLWKSLLPLNNNYWLFLIYCAWCIVVYWCNSYTIIHFSLDIVEWFKYKLKKVLNCTWYWFTPLLVSTIGIRAGYLQYSLTTGRKILWRNGRQNSKWDSTIWWKQFWILE
jgi:hypothetical protein